MLFVKNCKILLEIALDIDSIKLIKKTIGFNGADIEAVVKDTIEKAFIEGKNEITTDDLMDTIQDTKSISQTLKDRIESLRKAIMNVDIKPASYPDENGKK